jgi:hypothetical protein
MLHFRRVRDESVTIRPSEPGDTVQVKVSVTIEGKEVLVEPREYTGADLRKLGGIGPNDKLVREEADGSETAIPPAAKVTPVAGQNFFVSHRHRRG